MSRFNNWKNDPYSKLWLKAMDYKLSEIKSVEAIIISGYKTDVQVQVRIKMTKAINIENLQVKLVSNPQGFNQIDKRWIDKYKEMWEIPPNVVKILKYYTGEILPTISHPRDPRRTFLNEIPKVNQDLIINWFKNNKMLIVNDLLKGRGKFSAEWILVIQRSENEIKWVLKPINIVLNYYGNGEVVITRLGNLRIGNITMQRKGGDGGRKSAQMLQFKINPAKLFGI